MGPKLCLEDFSPDLRWCPIGSGVSRSSSKVTWPTYLESVMEQLNCRFAPFGKVGNNPRSEAYMLIKRWHLRTVFICIYYLFICIYRICLLTLDVNLCSSGGVNVGKIYIAKWVFAKGHQRPPSCCDFPELDILDDHMDFAWWYEFLKKTTRAPGIRNACTPTVPWAFESQQKMTSNHCNTMVC